MKSACREWRNKSWGRTWVWGDRKSPSRGCFASSRTDRTRRRKSRLTGVPQRRRKFSSRKAPRRRSFSARNTWAKIIWRIIFVRRYKWVTTRPRICRSWLKASDRRSFVRNAAVNVKVPTAITIGSTARKPSRWVRRICRSKTLTRNHRFTSRRRNQTAEL